MSKKPGAYGPTKDATEETQKLCDQVNREQVVAGSNFLIKVHVGGDCYIHLKVSQALPCNGGGVELMAVQENHTKDDTLEPF